jgi:hypothetical protein
MLYLISGAVAAGKSTISTAVADRVTNLVRLEEDQRSAKTGEDRMANLELWIQDALELEAEGKDVVFGSQAPLGEFLAAPSAVKLEGIAPCLLDLHDYERRTRWIEDGVHSDWPIGMDHFCWSAYHRMHARDPQFEQHVCLDREWDPAMWSRWTDWKEGDPRWDVFIYDSTESVIEETVSAVADWVLSVRENGAPLRRDAEWWK